MAISIADKFEFDIPTHADTLKIPTNVLKLIVQKLWGMAAWRLIPDQVYFIEISKVYPPSTDGFKVNIDGPVLINGVDNIVIGLRPGQGTNEATTLAYICKAAKTVFDLSPWYDTMDSRLK